VRPRVLRAEIATARYAVDTSCIPFECDMQFATLFSADPYILLAPVHRSVPGNTLCTHALVP
jgi:hypothetical protein